MVAPRRTELLAKADLRAFDLRFELAIAAFKRDLITWFVALTSVATIIIILGVMFALASVGR